MHWAGRDLRVWCERLCGGSRELWSELKGWAKNPSPSQRIESLLQSRELDGVRDIVIRRTLRRAFRGRDGAVRLAATPHGNDSGADHFQMLIPWSEVLALVVGKEFSSAIRQEARKIGFTGEMEPE